MFRRFRGTSALIVHGDLRNAITATCVGDGVQVGGLRTARSRTGQSLVVDFAALNELARDRTSCGSRPRRAFLHAAFRKAGLDRPGYGGPSTGRAVLRSPRRPYLGPVFHQYAQPEDVSRRFLARVAKNLGGDFGYP